MPRTRPSSLLAMLLLACGASAPQPGAQSLPAAKPEAVCTVSKATEKMLQQLRRPVVVEAYITQDTTTQKAFAGKVERLLNAFSAASKNVVARVVNPSTRTDGESAEKLGLKKQTEGTDAYAGVVVTSGAERDVIPLLPTGNDAGLEFLLMKEIRQMSEKSENVRHRIGLLVGHDEMSLSEANLVPSQFGKPSMREIIERNFPFYAFVDVDLHGGSAPVDASLEGVLVTQPARDLQEPELRALDAFVMRGKMLVVIASAVNVAPGDGTMLATLSTHGLDRLLGGYGIEMHRDVVLDFGSALTVDLMTDSGPAHVRYPQMPRILDDDRLRGDARALDTAFPAFFKLEELTVPFASSLTLHRDKQPNAAMKIVARSSPHSVLDAHDTVDLGLHAWNPKGPWGQYDVAAYAEGALESAFGSTRATGTARVLAISSSQLGANPFARAGNATGTAKGDDKLLAIAGPYADLQRVTVPLLFAILTFAKVLDMIAAGPELSAIAAQPACP